MRVIRIFFCLAVLLSSVAVPARAQHSGHASGRQFYMEFGGAGVIMGAFYDSRFRNGAGLGLGYRVGVGFGANEVFIDDEYGGYSQDRSYVTIPAGINYVLGRPTSSASIEFGVGVTYLTQKVTLYSYEDGGRGENAGHFIGTVSVMFRLKPVDRGFTWRIGYTPIIGTSGDFRPSGAIGIGYAF